MLRRLTVRLTVLSLLLVSVAPFTATAFATPSNNHTNHGQQRPARKLAPEFDSPAGSGETVRVIVQTKGHPTAAHDQAIASRRGTKRQTCDALDVLVDGYAYGSLSMTAYTLDHTVRQREAETPQGSPPTPLDVPPDESNI